MATDKLVDFDHVTDYISREAAIERFCNVYCGCSPEECGFKIPQDGAEECAAVRALKETPAADVRPVVRGKWIVHTSDLFPADSTIECDQCHAEQPAGIDDNFCPNCGADMRGPNLDTTKGERRDNSSG